MAPEPVLNEVVPLEDPAAAAEEGPLSDQLTSQQPEMEQQLPPFNPFAQHMEPQGGFESPGIFGWELDPWQNLNHRMTSSPTPSEGIVRRALSRVC